MNVKLRECSPREENPTYVKLLKEKVATTLKSDWWHIYAWVSVKIHKKCYKNAMKVFYYWSKRKRRQKSADEKLYIEIRGKFFKEYKKRIKNCGMIENENILWAVERINKKYYQRNDTVEFFSCLLKALQCILFFSLLSWIVAAVAKSFHCSLSLNQFENLFHWHTLNNQVWSDAEKYFTAACGC